MPMRSRLSFAAVVALVPAAVRAQPTPPDAAGAGPQVVVTATRSARLAADGAVLHVLVVGGGSSPRAAVQHAERLLLNATAAAGQLGTPVERLDVTLDGVTRVPTVNGFASSPDSAFRARYVLRLRPSRLDDLAPLTAAVVAAGASAAWPVVASSVIDSARRQRVDEALLQARNDAEAMASALGGRLGPVIEASTAPRAPDDGPFPSRSADLLVGATVTVRYRLLPR